LKEYFYKVPIVEPFDADAEDDDSDSFTARVNTVSFNPTVVQCFVWRRVDHFRFYINSRYNIRVPF
jgi:hypothetical protein